MKIIGILSLLILLFIYCEYTDVSGTITDVGTNASISGQLYTEDHQPVDFPVTVSLNKDSIFDSTIQTNNGKFVFDNLDSGTYRIEVWDDTLLGKKDNIQLGKNEQKEVNLTINIIQINISQNITINNFIIDKGSIRFTDSGYIFSFISDADSSYVDTTCFEMKFNRNDTIETAEVCILKDIDGTIRFEVLGGTDISITPGNTPTIIGPSLTNNSTPTRMVSSAREKLIDRSNITSRSKFKSSVKTNSLSSIIIGSMLRDLNSS